MEPDQLSKQQQQCTYSTDQPTKPWFVQHTPVNRWLTCSYGHPHHHLSLCPPPRTLHVIGGNRRRGKRPPKSAKTPDHEKNVNRRGKREGGKDLLEREREKKVTHSCSETNKAQIPPLEGEISPPLTVHVIVRLTIRGCLDPATEGASERLRPRRSRCRRRRGCCCCCSCGRGTLRSDGDGLDAAAFLVVAQPDVLGRHPNDGEDDGADFPESRKKRVCRLGQGRKGVEFGS